MLLVTVLTVSLAHPGLSGAAGSNESSLGLGSRTSAPAPLTLPGAGKLNPLQKAYVDAYSILSHVNSCSNFFGGSAAINALNGLTQSMQTTLMQRDIIVIMKGNTMIFTDPSGFSYRLFQRAEINLNGPFYAGNQLPGRAIIPRVGKFEPNTREARVAALLHEVGHLVRGVDGRWLLPDDGWNSDVSRANTEKVIAICGGEIRQLKGITFEAELADLQTPPRPELVAGNK